MKKLATWSLAAGIALLATGAWAQQQDNVWESPALASADSESDAHQSSGEPAEALSHSHSADGKCTIFAAESGATTSVCCEGQPGHHRHQAAETPPPPPPAPPRPIPYADRG